MPMTDRLPCLPALLASAVLLLARPVTAAESGSALARTALEVCSGAGDISVSATETRALTAGWPAFASQNVRGQATRKSEWLLKGENNRIDDLAVLGLSSTPPFPIPAGQKSLVCMIMLPGAKVAAAMRQAAEIHQVPLENSGLFLKREGGTVRKLELMEMLDEFPAQAAKLKPGEQLILITPTVRGKLGDVTVAIVENPLKDAQ